MVYPNPPPTTETFVQELHVDPSQDKHTIVKNSWQWHTLERTLVLENRVPTCGGPEVLDSRRRSRMKGNLRRRPQKVIRGEEGIRRKRLRLKIQQRIEEDEEEAEQEGKYRQIPKADQKRTGEAKKRWEEIGITLRVLQASISLTVSWSWEEKRRKELEELRRRDRNTMWCDVRCWSHWRSWEEKKTREEIRRTQRDVDALFCKLQKADEKKVTNLRPVANEHRKAGNSHLPGFFFQFCDVATGNYLFTRRFHLQGFFFPQFCDVATRWESLTRRFSQISNDNF